MTYYSTIFVIKSSKIRYIDVRIVKKIIFGENKNIIGEKMKSLRVNSGLTQSQMAAKLQTMNLNIDQQMISKIEKNNRIVTDYEFACICVVLGVTPDDLLGDFFREMKRN